MSIAMLQKLHDPKLALADKLASQSGVNSIVGNEDAHRATLGVYDTTDRVETNFAGIDSNMHTFRGISVEAAAGLTLEARVHHAALREDHVKHRKSKKRARKRPPPAPSDTSLASRGAPRGALIAAL